MDTSPSLSEHQFNLGDTFGAFLISIIISSCLYGAACLQTWYYFRNYNDRILVRSSVLAILVLETLHTILSIHAVYYYVILNYDNPPALSTYIWSVFVILPVTTAINTIVHSFYATRIYQISQRKDWWTPILVCTLNVVQVGLSVVDTIDGSRIHSIAAIDDNKRSLTMGIAVLSCTAAEDVICAVALSYYLHRNRSGVKSTDTLINKLIVHAINNGALTSLASISAVIVLVPIPKNLVYLAIYEVVGNLYANSLLSTLNSRRSHVLIRASLPVTVDSSHLSFANPGSSSEISSTHAVDTPANVFPKSPGKVLVET